MQYVNIKNLEKYHPGYKDRSLIWCKVYFSMLSSSPEFEMMHETDKWRFIALVMLELQMKKPVPLDPRYLTMKGFDLKKRPISLSLKMLHNFVEVRNKSVTQSRVYREEYIEKSRVEEVQKDKFKKPTLEEITTHINQNNLQVDAENFFSFYESKGWTVGKSPMKDWKAAIRGWHSRNKDDDKPIRMFGGIKK